MPIIVLKKEKAYQEIKQAIIAGRMELTRIYTINEFSEIVGFGGTPVREALVILASEGFIVPIPRSGYQVKSLSIYDVLEIFHLRSVLEVEGAGFAAERITDADIHLLAENNRLEQELASSQHMNESYQSYRTGYDLNLEFHQTIARASGNMRLLDLVGKLLGESERILVKDPNITDPQQHNEILEQLKLRNKLGAQEAMKKHIEDTKNRLLSRF